jgi:CheY-like chemotaxis protein
MQKRILVADGDRSVRQTLRRALELEHYDVTLAKAGREAAYHCIVRRPDLALLDLKMPHLNGWEAVDLIKAFDPFLPLIVITANPNQYEQDVPARIDALIEKPLDLPLLLEVIRDLLTAADQERAARMIDPLGGRVFVSRRQGRLLGRCAEHPAQIHPASLTTNKLDQSEPESA